MSIDWFHLNGKVALMTGAAQGIGQAIAHALAESGAKLIISDWQAERLAHTAAALEHDSHTVSSVSLGRPGKPEEVAAVVLFLASGAATMSMVAVRHRNRDL